MRPIEDRAYLPLTNEISDSAGWEKRREELMDLLACCCYGKMPAPPEKAVYARELKRETLAYAGKATELRVELFTETPRGEYAFPVTLLIPNTVKKPKVFLHLAFRRELPDRYVPVEEILDRGYALAVVCYNDISPDSYNGDFSSGLAAKFIDLSWRHDRKADETGKIGIWAWGASRVLDWLMTVSEVDAKKTALIGHSRLGKTALWACACDRRFWCAVSNDSGFGGASSAKNGTGERVADFLEAGSWDWFCERFKQDLGKEDSRVYDQHMLLACVAPRLLCVGSARDDRGADPDGEYLSTLAASEVWKYYAAEGLPTQTSMPESGEKREGDRIHYHLRGGTHFLSRTDWNAYMDFLDDK